jgi:hypothetical protein
MDSGNPFDLTRKQRIIPVSLSTPRIYSAPLPLQPSSVPKQTVTENSMLDGYVNMNRNSWTNIPIGTHIRYKRKTGEIRRGGFIKSIKQSRDRGFIYELENDKINRNTPNYKLFVVYLDDISNVYVRSPQPLPAPPAPQLRERKVYNEDMTDMPGDEDNVSSYAVRDMLYLHIEKLNKKIARQDELISELSQKIDNIIDLIKLRINGKRTPSSRQKH